MCGCVHVRDFFKSEPFYLSHAGGVALAGTGGVTQERDCMYLYNMIPYVQIKEQGLFILFTFYFIKIKNNTVGKLPIHYTERKLLCF